MLTLSFTHNFAAEKLRQKRWTEKQKHSQESYPVHLLPGSSFQAKRLPPPPHRKPCVQMFRTKNFYTGEKMFVSAFPNEESNK